MKQYTIILMVLFHCIFNYSSSMAQGAVGAMPSLRGYIRETPALRLDKNFSSPSFSNIVHNRINLSWNLSSNFHVFFEFRNRLLHNQMFKDFPLYKDVLRKDPGLVDMSWVWLSDGPWMGHSMADRFYADWQWDNWRVRVGRQRINWGINMVSNPNDLFNTYSFFDFDYEEKPGSDAVRIQRFISDMSRVEVAVNPARNTRDMVAAGLFSINKWLYDIQALAGYYRHRMALGLGWAGSIGGAGFKGEATWFYDLERRMEIQRGNIVAATGIDYMFSNGTFGVLEFLYNGGYDRKTDDIFLITQPLRADNIMFSKYTVSLNAMHPISPVLQGGMAVMALTDINAIFLMPNLKYSLGRDLDIEIVGQIFTGGKGTIFEEAGSAKYILLQYSF